MAKSAILGGRTVKVEHRSSFDKSNLHLLTTKVGTITPIRKQLVIPSSGKARVAVHAELPPLATDAYLRTHLKLEAFYCPLRILYGGFQSWFAGESIYERGDGTWRRAELPWGLIPSIIIENQGASPAKHYYDADSDAVLQFGPNSLSDYFGVHFHKDGDGLFIPFLNTGNGNDRNEYYQGSDYDAQGIFVNLFPYLCYHRIVDHFYRNKNIQNPGFAPPAFNSVYPENFEVGYLPFLSCSEPKIIPFFSDSYETGGGETFADLFGDAAVEACHLLNGRAIFRTVQRNYGDDYFSAAKLDAQAGNPVTVQVDANGKFTIASLRLQNALQEFAEVNNYASPDYISACAARYGVSPSDAIVDKPVLLASADYPMFTKGVELNSQFVAGDNSSSRNPFANAGILGSSAGRATANGDSFDFTFDVKEPGYVMIMATLVPEANYATGISKDMRLFIRSGSLTDLPCSLLEGVGDEPIMKTEINGGYTNQGVFGYVQRYLYHKIGEVNQVSGLFRKGWSLQAFAPQRNILSDGSTIGSDFLEIQPTALDDVAAVSYGVSNYGVMMDCSIEMFVSEPLSESALPALVDPAREHGKSIYLKNGGSNLA